MIPLSRLRKAHSETTGATAATDSNDTAVAMDIGNAEGVRKSWLKRERAKEEANVDTLDKTRKAAATPPDNEVFVGANTMEIERVAAQRIYADVFSGVPDVQFLLDEYKAETGKDPMATDKDGDHYGFSQWLYDDRIMQIIGNMEHDGITTDRQNVVGKLATYMADTEAAIRERLGKESKQWSTKSLNERVSSLIRGTRRDDIEREVYEAELARRAQRDNEMSMAEDRDTPQWVARKVANMFEFAEGDEKPVEIKVNEQSSWGDVTAVDVVFAGYGFGGTHLVDSETDMGDGYDVVGAVTKMNDIITKTYDDGSQAHGRTMTVFLRKRNEQTPAQKKAALVRDKAEQAIAKRDCLEELGKQYKGQTSYSGKSLADEAMKDVDRVITLSDNSLVTLPKQKMQTKFWFGYGYCAGQDFDKAQNQQEKATGDGGQYFKHENLRYYDNLLAGLKSSNEIYRVNSEEGIRVSTVYVGTGTGRDTDTLYTKDPATGNYKMKPTVSKVDMADRVKIIEGVERARADFEAKLDAYLKRYGTSRIKADTYWADR